MSTETVRFLIPPAVATPRGARWAAAAAVWLLETVDALRVDPLAAVAAEPGATGTSSSTVRTSVHAS